MSKRILMFHSSSDLYGAGKIFITATQTLQEAGHVVVAVLSEEGPLSHILRKNGIEVLIVRLGILRRKYFNLAGVVNRIQVLRNSAGILKHLIDERKIEIVYSQTSAVLIGAIVARMSKTPHIWQVLEITQKPYWFYRLMSWALAKYSTRIIVASEAVRDHWKKHIPTQKMITVHYGVDASEYLTAHSSLKKELGVSEETIVVGMVGRVHYWKGQDYFLRIAGHISRKFPTIRFVMIGDAYPGYEYLYDTINSIIKEEGLEHKVTDLGFRNDIPHLLAGMDVFIQPSILPDPFPTVILEAMAASKPVVATGLGGAKEMVLHGQTGILMPLNQSKSVSEMIEPLLVSESERKKMGTLARKRLEEKFSVKEYQRKLCELIGDFPA